MPRTPLHPYELVQTIFAEIPRRSTHQRLPATGSMAPSPDCVKAPAQELEAGVEFDRLNRFKLLNDTTGHPRRILKSPSQDDICSSARRSRFEPLNDTTARPRHIFRKTPPPPIIRGLSTSEISILGTTAPANADICSSPRLNRFKLVDMADRPRRVFRKTPRPWRSKESVADSEQAGAVGKCTKSTDCPALQCTLPSGAPPAYVDERFNALKYCDFVACDWLNNSPLGIGQKRVRAHCEACDFLR